MKSRIAKATHNSESTDANAITNQVTLARQKSLGAHLDQLLTSRFLPARLARRVRIASKLPICLARCVRNLASHTEWRAYSDDVRIFFAIARRPDGDEQDAAVASMDVYFLDTHAAVYSAGNWAYGYGQGWWLDTVLPASFDSINGWWLDAVMFRADSRAEQSVSGKGGDGRAVAIRAVLPTDGVRTLVKPIAERRRIYSGRNSP